jgi:hypothetical protein
MEWREHDLANSFLAQINILPVPMALPSQFHSMVNTPQVLGINTLCNRLQINSVDVQGHWSEVFQREDVVGRISWLLVLYIFFS